MATYMIPVKCADCGRDWTWPAGTSAPHIRPHRCPPCKREHQAGYRRQHQRAARLKAKYGMSVSDYDAFLVEQDGACAICREEPKTPLFVDHCHRSGSVRGLLCIRCNTLLGYLEGGGFDLIEAAQRYLIR